MRFVGLQFAGGGLYVSHPLGTCGGDAAIGCDEDDVRQLPDAPLLDEGAGESVEVAEAFVVDGVAAFYPIEFAFVSVERIAEEFDALAF